MKLRSLEEVLEELEQEQEQNTRKLPTEYKIGQYIRQSSDKQVKKNKQSTALQDEDLRKKLIKRGWSDEDIVKFDKDQGMSGQKRIDQRIDMNSLYKGIEDGIIRAVAAYDASRLFRDLTRIQSSTFLDLCVRYDIPVITNQRTYWPSIRSDNKALYDKFEEAADFIDETVHGKLIPAKMRAIYQDGTYGGGAVPMGYIVDYEEDHETYKKYIPYEPHAALIRFLFRRFRELDGKLHMLGRELLRTRFRFPLFAGIDSVPHVAPRKEPDGYPLINRYGLIALLTNYAYIGWYVYDEVIVSKTNHTAIVDEEDFWYAHNLLAKYNPDGELNEKKATKPTRYTQEGTRPAEALLIDVIRSDALNVYPINLKKRYVARDRHDSYTKYDLLSIDIESIDTAYVDIMLKVLTACRMQEEKHGIEDGLYVRIKALQEEKEQEVGSIDDQLINADKLINKHERLKGITEDEDNEDEYREQVKKLKRLREAKRALEIKQKEAIREEASLEECEILIDCVINDWKSLKFAKKLQFVNLVTEDVNMTPACTHFIKLEVVFKEPINCTVVGYIYRRVGRHGEEWTNEDISVLRDLYPLADRTELLKVFPGRSWEAISARGQIENIIRETRLNTSGIHEKVTFSDEQLMRELGLDPLKEPAHNSVLWMTPTRNKNNSSCSQAAPIRLE